MGLTSKLYCSARTIQSEGGNHWTAIYQLRKDELTDRVFRTLLNDLPKDGGSYELQIKNAEGLDLNLQSYYTSLQETTRRLNLVDASEANIDLVSGAGTSLLLLGITSMSVGLYVASTATGTKTTGYNIMTAGSILTLMGTLIFGYVFKSLNPNCDKKIQSRKVE